MAVAVHTFVGEDNREDKTMCSTSGCMFKTWSAEVGRPMRAPARRGGSRPGMVFAGMPDKVAGCILNLHKQLGHSREILQMDVGGMPQMCLRVSNCSVNVLPKFENSSTRNELRNRGRGCACDGIRRK